MQTQNPSTETYVLGQAPEAIQRLLKQGQLLNPFTRRVFEEAGITAGMKVLDLGCGPGDVSLRPPNWWVRQSPCWALARGWTMRHGLYGGSQRDWQIGLMAAGKAELAQLAAELGV